MTLSINSLETDQYNFYLTKLEDENTYKLIIVPLISIPENSILELNFYYMNNTDYYYINNQQYNISLNNYIFCPKGQFKSNEKCEDIKNIVETSVKYTKDSNIFTLLFEPKEDCNSTIWAIF